MIAIFKKCMNYSFQQHYILILRCLYVKIVYIVAITLKAIMKDIVNYYS